ncbi:MAG: hypothetical protein QGG88_11760, partial [Gammaproteobacteria bacterium]|nr:hypothetical protein [Gammaproteobacteria bacterium]
MMLQLDMNKILDEFVSFDSISHSCIYKNGNILASTFPSVIRDKLTNIGSVIDKIFVTAESIDQNHDEIHFELEKNLLIAYRINNDFLLILLTANNVNLSLIYMTIKSVEKILKSNNEEQKSKIQYQVIEKVRDTNNAENINNPVKSPTDDNKDEYDQLKRKLVNLRSLLLDCFGPVATVIFEGAIKEWKNLHRPSIDNLDKLLELMLIQIEGQDEKNLFSARATRIIRTP